VVPKHSRAALSPLFAGRVGRPHGLDGSFVVREPRPALLTLGARVVVAGSEREIVRRAGLDSAPIIRLEGCSDRDAASALAGAELRVDAALAPALGEDEWYAEELEGCAVADGERAVGIVRRLLALPSCEVLEVVRGDGAEDLLVPLVSDAVRSVDLERNEIDIDLRFLGEA
jgi:16S rRNA processing protein RimM